MAFKYQKLFDELELDDCPPVGCKEVERVAYRWVFNPVDSSLNFLPNHEYNKQAGKPPARVIQKEDLCGHCNLSFFETVDQAEGNYKSIQERLEKKQRQLTDFYTHIAAGVIEKKDGVATLSKKGHFGFYEYHGCDFKAKFKIVKAII